MSLVDVDMGSLDRSSPQPNHSDRLNDGSIKAHKTISTHYATDADTNTGRLQMGNKQIITNNGTYTNSITGQQSDGKFATEYLDSNGNVVARFGEQADGTINAKFFDTSAVGVAQFGRFADGSTALKVAKSGIEVSTATNDQLIFNSSQDVFKIVAAGTISVSKGTNTVYASSSINHGLTYIPLVMGFVLILDSYQTVPFLQFSSTGVMNEQTDLWVDATTVNLEITTPNTGSNTLYTNAVSRSFKYYLLQESVN